MTSSALAVLLAGLAGLLGPAQRGEVLRRLAAVVPAAHAGAGRVGVPGWLPRALIGAAVGAWVVGRGGPASVLTVLAVTTSVPAARRRRDAEREHARLVADLPRAADLLAGCLDAGATTAAAVGSVATATGGPVGIRLATVARTLSAGAEITAPVAGSGDPVDRLVAAVARAAVTGAPLAALVRDLAVDERERARWAATERARVAGVRAVAPLAVCFLPAFVLVGVVPVVAGIAGSLLGTP